MGRTAQAERKGLQTRHSTSSYLRTNNTETMQRKQERVCEGRKRRETEGAGPSPPTASTVLPPSSGPRYGLVLPGSEAAGTRLPAGNHARDRAPSTAGALPVLWPARRALWDVDCQHPRKEAEPWGASGTLHAARARLGQDPLCTQLAQGVFSAFSPLGCSRPPTLSGA